MSRIIVAIPKRETGIQIRNLLVRNGFDVIGVCTSGVQILNYADVLEEGIVICSCQLKDMVYGELRADLPQSFEMLVLTTGRHPVEETAHIRTLSLPLKVQELLEQVRAMEEMFEWQRRKRRGRKSERNERQNQIISRAKAQLMEKKKYQKQRHTEHYPKYNSRRSIMSCHKQDDHRRNRCIKHKSGHSVCVKPGGCRIFSPDRIYNMQDHRYNDQSHTKSYRYDKDCIQFTYKGQRRHMIDRPDPQRIYDIFKAEDTAEHKTKDRRKDSGCRYDPGQRKPFKMIDQSSHDHQEQSLSHITEHNAENKGISKSYKHCGIISS